jgi:hypothetical protein
VNQQFIIGRDDDVDISRSAIEYRKLLEEADCFLYFASLATLCGKIEAAHFANVGTHCEYVYIAFDAFNRKKK